MKTKRANRTRPGDGRNNGGGRAPRRTLTPLAACIRRACLPAGVLLTLPFQAALAAPQGGQVVGGQGSISRAGTTTTINQQSQNLAVDWQSFNVNSNELVKFNQPSAKAAALNRIFDQNPSQIYGSIQANGTVLLLNPNGVIFQPGSHVNVGSLVAAGMQMSVGDFMSGNYKLENLSDSAGGAVINRGLIEAATGGSVTLAGKSVSNEGLILADAGRVNLAAGSKITLDFDGDGLIRFTVDKGVLKNAAGTNAAVSNTGTIIADGGQVLLTGKAAENVFSQVVNNQGVIKAARVENQGGVVKLVGLGPNSSVVNTGTINVAGQGAGSSGGTVTLTATNVTQRGTIDASAAAGDGGQIKLQAADTTTLGGDSVTIARSDSGGKGGTVQVLGNTVGLLDNSAVDVSGALGGGTALIGGDRHGANPDVQNASRTYVGPNAIIKADATESGNGGEVVVWSNDYTRYYGSLSAQGGPQGGNGGFAEVSGAQTLDFNGTVNLAAGPGTGYVNGTLLLDPASITIQSANPDLNGDGTTGDDITALTDLNNSANFPGAASIITNTAVDGLLTGSNTLILAATSNVDVNAAITGSGNANLTLNAPTVNLNVTITLAGTGVLSGSATTANVASGALVQNGIDVIDTGSGGTVNVAAGTYTEDLTITTNNLTLQGAGAGSTTIQGVATQTGFPDATSSTNVDLRANSVKIDGFTFKSPIADASTQSYSSGIVLKGTNIEISNNIFDIQQSGSGSFNGDTSSAIQTLSGLVPAQTPVDVSGLYIHNNTFQGTPANGYYGIYINPQDQPVDTAKPVVIDNNTFTGTIWRAITTERSYTNITNNSITTSTLNTAGNNSGIRAVSFAGQNITNINITGNTIAGAAAGDGFNFAIGLGSGTPSEALSAVTVSQNQLIGDNNTGIAVNVSAANIVISNNDLSGFKSGGMAVTNDDAANGTLDASGNWWGLTTGTGIAGIVGGTSTGGVDFSPFLVSGTDTNAGTAGFQGDFSTVTVTLQGAQSGATGRIDEGIGLATTKVNVEAGDYSAENVNLNNAVELAFNGSGASTVNNLTTSAGSLTVASGGSLTANGTSNLGTNVTTTGAALDFKGAVTLAANVTLDTTNGGGASGANVSFGSTVDADNASTNDRTLTVTAGTGTVTLGGAVGGTQALADLDVSGALIKLGGNLTVNDGAAQTVTLTGPVELDNNVTITTAGTNDHSVSFTSTVNADSAANNRTLTVAAGTGTVTFGGNVGASQALADLDVTGGTINLNAGTYDVNAGAGGNTVTLSGAVVLGTSAAFDTTGNNLTFSSGGSLDGTSAFAQNLTITAGTGNVSFLGTVGTSKNLGDVLINSGGSLVINSNSVTPGKDAASTTDTFLANSLTATLSNTVDIGGAGVGDGGDVILQGSSVTNALDIKSTNAITINSNIIAQNGNILLEATGSGQDVTVDVAGLPALGAYNTTTKCCVAERTVQALAGDVTTLVDKGGANTLLNDYQSGGTSTVPVDGMNTVLSASGTVSADSVKTGNNLKDSVFPQITSPTINLTYTGNLMLGDDAAGARGSGTTISDSSMDGLLGSGTTLNISTTGGDIILDRASPFTAASGSDNLSLTTDQLITDNSATVAFQSTGTLTLTSNGTIGIDNTSGLNTDGTMLVDVSTLVVNSTGGNDVNITDNGVGGSTSYSVTTGGAGNVTLTQQSNNADISALSTTGNATVTASTGNVNVNTTLDGLGAASFQATSGNVVFNNAVGATTALASLTASGNAISVLQSVKTTGLQSYTGATTLNGNLTSTTGGAITITGAATIATGAITVQTAGAAATDDITFTSTINGGQALTLNAGTAGDVSIGGAAGGTTPLTSLAAEGATVSTQAVTTTGDQIYVGGTSISFAGAVQTTGGGELKLLPTSDGTSIGVGSSAAGTLTLSDATLGNITNGFADIKIGSKTGTALVDVNTGSSFLDPLVLRSSGAGGTVAVNGTLAGTGNASITFYSGAGTTLNADVTTAGQPIDINGSVVVGSPATVTLDTTTGSKTAGAAITVTGTIDDDGSASTLVLNGGTKGAIDLQQAVGGGTPLAGLTIAGLTANLPAVTTSGAQDYTNVGTSTLNGTLSVNTAGAGVKAGNVSLAAGGGAITLNGSNAANDVTLGTVDGAQALDITAGGGDIVLGTVGGTTPLASVTLSANTAGLQSVTTTGSQSYTASVTLAAGATLQVDSDNNSLETLTLAGSLSAGAGAQLAGGTDGNDILASTGGANNWAISGSDAGTLNGVTFSNFGTLNGGTSNDTFAFSGTGALTGSIDGGAGGTNTLDWSALSTARSVTLTGSNANGFAGSEASIAGGFNNITAMVGSSAATDALTGDNNASTWVPAAGTYNDGTATLSFSGFEDLIGGSGSDLFTFTGTQTFAGSIDGGAGSDTIDFSGSTLFEEVTASNGTIDGQQGTIKGVAPNVGTDLLSGTFDNIDVLTGNNKGQIIGPNVDTAWTISGVNSGTFLPSGGKLTTFNNFSIFGGTANDSFQITNAGQITSGINGGLGTNTVQGSLNGADPAYAWTISGPNSLSVKNAIGTTNLTNIQAVQGSAGDDTFSINNGVTFAGSIDGLGGANTLDWSAFTSARNVTLTAVGGTTGFDGTEASITGGFKDITVIKGGSATDSLTGLNAVSTWALSGPGTETYTSTNTLPFSSFENLNGGSNTDTFNVTGAHTGNVSGGGGGDSFVFTGAGGKISGSLNGGAGGDTLDYSGYTGGGLTVTLSGAGTIDGFKGTEPNTITGGFDNIDGVNASKGSTFVAPNTANTWDITASNTFTLNGSSVPFTGFTNLTGGNSTDTFDLNGGTMTGLISGGGGNDTLVGDNTVNTWTITGTNAGTVSGANGTQNFTGIANLTGNAQADTFTFNAGGSLSGVLDGAGGTDSASYAAVAAPLTLTVGANVLNMESLTGNASRSDQVLVGDSSGANTWTITGPNDGTVGSVTFTDFNTIRTGAAGDTFTSVPVSYTGSVEIQGNATWNYTPGAQLGSSISSVGGPVGVSLTVPTTPGADVTISSADLRLPVPTNMTAFKGRLVIGGTLADPGVADVMTTTVTAINANSLTVADNSLQTGGDIVLLAGDINLNDGSLISAGGAGGAGTATLFAGNLGSATANGDISGPTSGTATIEGGSINLIANDNIVNPGNIAIDATFNGTLLVAVSASQLQPDFSNPNNAFSGGQFDAVQLANFVGNFGANLQSFEINLINPGSQLVQQALLGFVDVSVFNQELTLFGVIGNGIALSLDQCEEAEGCAPSVNEAQLKQLISDLQARIDEVEKRKADGKISAEEADKLLTGYREKLKNFQEYSVQLKQYLEQQQNAGGEFGPEDFGPGPGPGPGDEGPGPGDEGPGPGDEGPGPGPAGPQSTPAPGPTDKGAQEKKIDEEFGDPQFEQGRHSRTPGSITVPQPQTRPAPIQASAQRSLFGSLAWDGRAAMPVRYQRY